MTTEPTRTIVATVGRETIVLTVCGGADGSLVISDGRGDTLITLNMLRAPALCAACALLAEQGAAPAEQALPHRPDVRRPVSANPDSPMSRSEE
jgi:hypothetical protein